MAMPANARSTNLRRFTFCSLSGKFTSLTGLVIAIPGIIRLEPVTLATGVILVIWAVGRPAISNSLTIVAPQRVQLPQVLVIITAFTLAAINSAAISLPMRLASFRAVRLPVVA